MAEIRKHTTWTEVKKEMDERDTRKLAEEIADRLIGEGNPGGLVYRGALVSEVIEFAAHLQPAPTEGPSVRIGIWLIHNMQTWPPHSH